MGVGASTPVDLIRVQKSRGRVATVAVAEMQGWRDSHEDAHFFDEPDGGITWAHFGVLDGHGGQLAAKLAAEKLPPALKKATKGRKALEGPAPLKTATAFEEVDAELSTIMQEEPSGATCISGGCKAQPNGKYTCYLANAGDSRGILIRFRRNDDARARAATPEEMVAAQKALAIIKAQEDGEEEEEKSPKSPKRASEESEGKEGEAKNDGKKKLVCDGPLIPCTVNIAARNSTILSAERQFGGADPIEKEKSGKFAAVARDEETEDENDKPRDSVVEDAGYRVVLDYLASEDHKPDRKDEYERITKAGGFVSGGKVNQMEDNDKKDRNALMSLMAGDCARLDGNLAVSRGFADFTYKRDKSLKWSEQKVSNTPEIFQVHDMERGDLMLLACDGIFDVLSNDELIALVLSELHIEVSRAVTAAKKGGCELPFNHMEARAEDAKDNNKDTTNSSKKKGASKKAEEKERKGSAEKSEEKEEEKVEEKKELSYRREDILGRVCRKVLETCLTNESRDNMTMMIVQLGAPNEPKEVVFPTLPLNVGASHPHALTDEAAMKNVLQSPQQAAAGGQGGASPQQKEGGSPKEVKLPTFEQALLLPQNLTKLANNMAEEKTRSSFHEFIDFLKKSPHPIDVPDDVAKACFYGSYAHLAPQKGRGRGPPQSLIYGTAGPDANLLNLAKALRGQLDDSDGLIPDSPESPKPFSPTSRVTGESSGPVIEEVVDDSDEGVELILPSSRKSGSAEKEGTTKHDVADGAAEEDTSSGSTGALNGSTAGSTASDTSNGAGEEAGSDSAECDSPKSQPSADNPAPKSANKKRKKK